MAQATTVPELEVIERGDRPELEARLHVRETPTVVRVCGGRVAGAAVGTRACLRFLRRLG